jgi:predicted aldo/keto reductase-like oxidoreductase
MRYRKFGRLDWEVSVLGLGLDCLPDNADEAKKIIRYGIEHGVNYIDAGALPATGNPQLTPVLTKALSGGYRQKVKIAATMPPENLSSGLDFDRELENLLKRLPPGSLDFLTVGGLNRFTWPTILETDILKRAAAAIAARKISHLGFSFRDQFHYLRDILESYDNWAFVQFHYSLMDGDRLPGVTGLQLAAGKGLAVAAAKPLLGGRLVNNIPKSVAEIWAGAEPQRSPAEWALRWAWNHSEISTVASDAVNINQLKQNLALADKAAADSFTVSEELTINRVRDAYRTLKPFPCTTCRGCMPPGGPCPQGIDAPRIFEIYNDAVMYGDTATGKLIYRREKHNIDLCNECGVCADACGFKFPIPDWLKKARGLLE